MSAAGPGWREYRDSIGDRSSLFAAISDRWRPQRGLYLGSYLDLSPSTAIPSVTYVDTDRRAARFFGKPERVMRDLRGHTRPGAGSEVKFLGADYTRPLPVEPASFDLLISLFAGPSWDHTAQYLAPSGLYLANSSHGDASLAALDPAMRLVAAVVERDESYSLDTADLETYLVPRDPSAATADVIRQTGRGVRYTREAFAYLFEHTPPETD